MASIFIGQIINLELVLIAMTDIYDSYIYLNLK